VQPPTHWWKSSTCDDAASRSGVLNGECIPQSDQNPFQLIKTHPIIPPIVESRRPGGLVVCQLLCNLELPVSTPRKRNDMFVFPGK
jgi:hypothetical protein